MFLDLCIVGASGAIGAMVRYVSYVMGQMFGPTMSFPYVTFLVNVLGCFLAGIAMMWIEQAGVFHRPVYLAGVMGFLGAFTTFSAFGVETFQLIRNEQLGMALLTIGANVVFGLLAVWLGRLVIG